ncbi:MAG TPA: type II toxin-antitoxin system PemK/MazF family toxin [Anaerolineales bacterium]|nr:type II toxin-antitoxin system PemK/MazF family toxin [Anaerolineales bacterium]
MKHKVVLVPFPFDDLSSTKVRPAVCLTEPIGEHKHVVLAFITSRVPEEPLSTDLIFTETDKDFSVTGLRVSSALQLHRMMTVATNIIVRELGTLPKSAQKDVERKLKLLFGIK